MVIHNLKQNPRHQNRPESELPQQNYLNSIRDTNLVQNDAKVIINKVHTYDGDENKKKAEEDHEQSECQMHDGGELQNPHNSGSYSADYPTQKSNRNQYEIPNPQPASKPRRKKLKKIKRYESNSVDEEEFQDYFTNPIKRKEFDRQRKFQQMKEMQNITGFTLGQFGIKSMRAMREAMPQLEEEELEPVEAQKNYATVSLCCLSVTNPFRNKVIQLVAVNPWFDRIILFVIMINCCFLALDKEVDVITANNETIDFIFLNIYTFEMILKIIAMGFFMRPHSYLRDSWNILDFTVVMLGWVSKIFANSNISAIKVIRILRPLRTINQIPNMSSLVKTILNSLPVMFDVMILFFFMLVMFGTIATQLLGGHLQNMCQRVGELGNNYTFFGDPNDISYCMNDTDCTTKYSTDLYQNVSCQYQGNPVFGTFAFDNLLLSLMNMFIVITLEGWTGMMYTIRLSEGTRAYDFFFLGCVLLGAFVILNLLIAVQANFLDKAFDAEDARALEIKNKAELKKKIKQEIEMEEMKEEGENLDEQMQIAFEQQNSENFDDGINGGDRKSTQKRKNKKKACCQCTRPACCISASNRIEEMVEAKPFDNMIIFFILLNTFVMSLDFYDPPDWLVTACQIANYFFTAVFAIEMVLKLLGFGFKKYNSDTYNQFDAFIVIMSYVDLCMPAGNKKLAVLRAFRILRIFKIIKSWGTLRILLTTVMGSIAAISNLGILLMLYLFISALLTKQFFGDKNNLLESDTQGTPSRYDFSGTIEALITCFIILTSENWNDVMTQTIYQQQSFVPAILFIFLLVLGNIMLLNLFLAILLKSISQIDNSPPNEAEQEAVVDAAIQPNAADEPQLDSSNSNVEEEFEQIKSQLMALCCNINVMEENQRSAKGPDELDIGQKLDQNFDEPDQEQNYHNDAKNELNQSVQPEQIAQQEGNGEEDGGYEFTTSSLFILGPKNEFRIWLKKVVYSSYFAGLIYHMIALNSLILALNEPSLVDLYQDLTMGLILNVISGVFVAECVLKILVQGLYFGSEKTYLKETWNILDFVIVLFSVLTWILEAVIQSDISFIRGFRALRALRPLRVVSKNEGMKLVVNAILESLPTLFNVLLIVLLFLLVFGILGIQLFKGKQGTCNDSDPLILTKQDCIGWYLVPFLDQDQLPIGFTRVQRAWFVPFNSYDNILQSMTSWFEVTTLECWPTALYRAIDSNDYDAVPIVNNAVANSIVFVLFIFSITFFIMNLFVSVIVDKFNDEIKKRQGSDNFTDEQKEWVKIQRLLVRTDPKIIPVEPINCFRLQCFKIVQSQAFEYIVMTAIGINTFFLCIDYYGKSDELAAALDRSNTTFVVFFTCEAVLKLTAYGFRYYWYVNWNKFDVIIVSFSLISVDQQLLQALNFNPTALRIIRVSRLLRMIKTSEGLRTLLKTLYMSLGNILNTAALMALVLFTFCIAGMSLFSTVPYGDNFNDDMNFKSFYIAMLSLVRCTTGESWNWVMHDCYEATGISAIFYWITFELVAFFVFLNVFIAVIGESFNDNQASENENDILALKKKDIKAFQNTWAKFNPMGELYMRTVRLPDFLRELPPPLGYQGIRIEEAKLNKIIFCLNIRDHQGRVYYPEVMWAIFHSVAGMNDEKVLNCQQILDILKLVKSKYKGLGKKISLDSLCGNKYYRKELTAIKYIQAIKILGKWRDFKTMNEEKLMEDKQQLAIQSPGPKSQHDKVEEEIQAQDHEYDRNLNPSANNKTINPEISMTTSFMAKQRETQQRQQREMRLKAIEQQQANNRRDDQSISQQQLRAQGREGVPQRLYALEAHQEGSEQTYDDQERRQGNKPGSGAKDDFGDQSSQMQIGRGRNNPNLNPQKKLYFEDQSYGQEEIGNVQQESSRYLKGQGQQYNLRRGAEDRLNQFEDMESADREMGNMTERNPVSARQPDGNQHRARELQSTSAQDPTVQKKSQQPLPRKRGNLVQQQLKGKFTSER